MMDDRTAKAKLRDAAIEIVAAEGSKELTARGVAERAGLSAGLIRHHFGSMRELQAACDEHVARAIKELKTSAIRGGAAFDAFGAIRQSADPHLMGYLAMRLSENSPVIDRLVDTIVDDATAYLTDGITQGLFTPTRHPRERTAMLTIFTLGALALHRHVKRLMNVDVRAADLASQPGFVDYLRAQMEVLAGVATPETVARYGALLENLPDTLQEQP